MITSSTLWIILVVGLGLPGALIGAVVGFFFKRLERKLDDAEDSRKEMAELRIKHEVMLIDVSMTSLSLAEATAEAVQRIPDANCNGEMKDALSKAKGIQEKYRNFQREQTVKALKGGE